MSLVDLPGINEEEVESAVKDALDVCHVVILAADVRSLEGEDATKFRRFIKESGVSRNPRFFVGTNAD